MTKVNDTWEDLQAKIGQYAVNLLEVAGSSPLRFRNWVGNDSGHALVEVSGGTVTATVDTSALATQTTLADLPGTTTHVDVTATTFDPPLRMIMNNSATAGTISFKGPGDSSEVDMYLAAGEKVGLVQIAEVTDVDSLTLVGGY